MENSSVSKLPFIVLSAVFALVLTAKSVWADEADGYKLLPGDSLQISVWREEIRS